MFREIKHAKTVLNPTALAQINRARKHGIINPVRAYNAAKKAGIDFALACAILMRESSGGMNIFGHDPTICVGWGLVTKIKYDLYLQLRRKTGLYQGVGPCQLTSPGLQDEADAIAGCQDVYSNMLVGFKFLHNLIKQHRGIENGIRAYNGSGPAADEYAKAVMASRTTWQHILSGRSLAGVK